MEAGSGGQTQQGPGRRPQRSWTGTALLILAGGLLLTGGGLAALPIYEQSGWDRPFHGHSVSGPPPAFSAASEPVAEPPAPQAPPPGGVDFMLTVPAIGYRAAVLEGTGSDVLARGPGHYVTTAWPGRSGNIGVAAHNTYWLAFGSLAVGDVVEIQTSGQTLDYSITSIRVVSPDDRTVLAPTNDSRLTLTTCYPLWAGAAAFRRLVFTASLETTSNRAARWSG